MPKGVYKKTKEHLEKLKKTGFQKGHKVNLGRKRLDILGENHFNWKGGKIKSPYGYIFVYKPEHPFRNALNYVREHRLIVEKYLGHYLLPTEHCHHINEIKDDNCPENLMAFTSESAHIRFHKDPNNVRPEEIIFDGRKLKRR